LTGPIPIPGPVTGRNINKQFRVRIPAEFPFAWPRVSTLTPPSALTWHLDPWGQLCLFRATDNPARPWDTVDGLFDRVWYWHDQAAKGWPDDPGDPDLDRYFKHHTAYLITYDGDEHPTGRLVGLDVHRSDWRHLTTSEANRKHHRRDKNLWWFGADVGVLDKPFWSWSTLLKALPEDKAEEVRDLGMHGDGVLLIHYRRQPPQGTRTAAIALFVQAPKATPAKHHGRVTTAPALAANAEPTLATLQIADDSLKARWYRAGSEAETLSTKHLAIVGCGAIGSFTADLLARSGIGKLTLIDGDRLVPGNCVRHLADRSHVPKPKVDAVRDILVDRGIMTTDDITVIGERLDAETAVNLLVNTDLVIDATANATVSSLLRDLADHIGRVNFIKIGLYREGGIVRVDRYGQRTRPDEDRPPFIAAPVETGPTYREAGCGDPVSATPPTAVLHAAATATRFAVDYLQPSNRRSLPDSQVEVLSPQPDAPWQTIGSTNGPVVTDAVSAKEEGSSPASRPVAG
jgi:molybdopterin/thiamine biosynthesis adenylyltransferase